MAQLNDEILVKFKSNPSEIAGAFSKIRDVLAALAEAFDGMAKVARDGAAEIDAVVQSFNEREVQIPDAAISINEERSLSTHRFTY